MLTICFIGFTGLEEKFDIIDENTSTQAIPYDYKSVMHPRLNAFAKRRTNTIVPLMYSGHISQTAYPTAFDILHLNTMYCGGNK